ncbi:MAG: MBL fold metallo-hydrolase [Clostridia bacterium]|nr:MBL fold metallo-hydrolase [Clostridia bacterium]
MAKGFRVTVKTLHSEVTGSAFILKIKRPGEISRKVLIDFGGYQEEKYEAFNGALEFEPSEIDAVIVTHSHLDHIFKLPLLHKNGYLGNIYCSKGASLSIPISLRDSVKVMITEYEKYRKPVIYALKDVVRTVEHLTPVGYGKTKEIIPGVKMTLLENGHLYGAACILLQISCKNYPTMNYLFTGDFYLTNELFSVAPFPEFVYELRNLSIFIESTYADTKSDEVSKNFDKYLLEAVQKKHFIVIPSIAQERLELVLLRLKILQDCKLLDLSIPIYIHSELGKQYYQIVYSGKEFVEYMPKNCKFIEKGDYETVIKDSSKPKILLASSGMADKGNIMFYLTKVVSDPAATILFTCYQGRNTLGFKIKNSNIGDDIFINGKPHKRLCDVKYTSQFSHHIKQDESIELLSRFHYLKNIFINHGEERKKVLLNDIFQKIYPDKGVFTMNRNIGYRISATDGVTSYETSLPSVSYYKTQTKQYNKFKRITKKRDFKKRHYNY